MAEINLPWIEKYRPKSISDLSSHGEILTTLKKFVNEDNMPHLLFYGPPGTGKTSTILALANEIYTQKERHSLVLELNASDERGISTVRETVIQFASTMATIKSNKFKLIILDEADSMTNIAQSALRRVIEKYTKSVRFCLICNYLSKIAPAIQSRCTRYRFQPLDKTLLSNKLIEIAKCENVKHNEAIINSIIDLCDGDLRRGINILQACHMSYGPALNEDNVYSCIGQPTPKEIEFIVNILMNENAKECHEKIKQLKHQRGFSLMDILVRISNFIIKIKFPPEIKMYILSEIATIEEQLSKATNEKIQLSALISAVSIARYHVKSEIQ